MRKFKLLVLTSLFLCGLIQSAAYSAAVTKKDTPIMNDHPTIAKATFAGGCFWCMEPPFDKLDGVIATISGYMGGHTDNPTYEQVTSGTTGHAEVIQIHYDPSRVDYQALLEVFWMNINPTDAGGQFVDRGSQYRPVIFYHDTEQKQLAEQSRSELAVSGRFTAPISTEIVAATAFYQAESYHQDYYLNSPVRYKFYRYNSGRDQYLNRIWGEKTQ